MTILISRASFVRPSNTTPYNSGDLIANSTTAGNVTPMEFLCGNFDDKGFIIRGVTLRKSTNTTTNASFTLHLFNESPTVANGDNGSLSVATLSTHMSSIPLDLSSSGISSISSDGSLLRHFSPTLQYPSFAKSEKIWGLLVANTTTYTPGSQEKFEVTLRMSSS